MTTRGAVRGFTLIELMVTLGVVALLALAATPALRSVSGANARQAAGELAGTLRFLFDTAALRHATCRLAISLDQRKTWAECAAGAATIDRDPATAPTDAELADRFPDEKDAEVRRLLAGTRFGRFDDRLAPRRTLPGGVTLGPVRVEGRTEPITAGMAYVYFFPGGRAQRALVPVRDGSTHFTVVLEPFTGRARVVAGDVRDDR